MSHGRLALVLPALALLFATACAAAVPPTASPAPATPSPAPTSTPHPFTVPEPLKGTWQATIHGASVSPGLWTMEITRNQILATNPGQDAQPFALGLTDITGDQATFYADQACQAGYLKEGTYTFAIAADQLTFTLIQDNCRDRAALLTAASWARQP